MLLVPTGDLVNGETELAWLDAKVKETEAIKEFDYYDLSFPASSTKQKRSIIIKKKCTTLVGLQTSAIMC